jgi:ureidoacrylate peracid hydrolase
MVSTKPGGSYDKLGMNIENYQKVVPEIQKLINFCRTKGIPIFYTEAVCEPSGIDLLLNINSILPKTREERLEKIPICVRGTWDAQTIDEIKPTEKYCFWHNKTLRNHFRKSPRLLRHSNTSS